MSTPRKRDRSIRRQLWAFLSLLSLVALAAPQYLWACSMTGKLGSTPASACPCAAAVKQAAAQCGMDQSVEQNRHEVAHSCCNQVPLPTSESTGHNERGQLSKAPGATFAYESAVVPGTLAVLPARVEFALASQGAGYSPINSLRLISQQTSSVHSGRAPPF